MIREKRLSPRRARSLAFLFLLGRTQGSPKTTPHPPAASADSRHTERETPRFCTPMSTLVLDARLHSARLAAVVRLSSTARLQRKSTVCGLSGLRPDFAGPLQLNPQPASGYVAALALESLCAVSTGELPF